MKNNSQDRVSELERQIISLQRELDEARRQSTSMWCKIHDLCLNLELSEETSTMLTEAISGIVKDWVRDQRSKMGRRYSSLGSMPPYTDCLNDVTVSISNPEAEIDLEPYSYEQEDLPQGEEPISAYDLYDNSAAVRIPPPPPPNLVSNQGDFGGPPKMMRVNVPRPFSAAPPSELPPA
jgi:hypothetical protein